MRRLAILLGLIIVAAIAVAIGVAWACAAWAPPQRRLPLTAVDAGHPMAVMIGRHVEFDRQGVVGEEGFGWRQRRIFVVRSEYALETEVNQNNLRLFEAGWPLLCMAGHRRVIEGREAEEALLARPSLLPALRNSMSDLPLRPRLVPLIVNALIFAAPFCVVIGWRAGRLAHRRRRGRCMRCGFDLRGSVGACPECGQRC